MKKKTLFMLLAVVLATAATACGIRVVEASSLPTPPPEPASGAFSEEIIWRQAEYEVPGSMWNHDYVVTLTRTFISEVGQMYCLITEGAGGYRGMFDRECWLVEPAD